MTLPGTDYERMAAVYDEGRALPLDALVGWRDALHDHLPLPTGLAVLDVGSGTGIFSFAIAEWFETWVIGIEPSDAMRRQAVLKRSHPLVSYLGGRAEEIPLVGESCVCAWLSTVVHHISDLSSCALELKRVLAPHAPVLIRNAFSDLTFDVTWLRYFPEAAAIAQERWPTVEHTAETFSSAGFEKIDLREVEQVTAPNLRDYCDMIGSRADSSLSLISDRDFARGMAALEKAAEESETGPVIDRLHLLVLR